MKMSQYQVFAFFAIGISSGVVAACICNALTDGREMSPEAVLNAQGKLDFRFGTQAKDITASLPLSCKFTNTGDSAFIVQKQLSADMMMLYDETGNEVIPESRFEHVSYGTMASSDCVILKARGDSYAPSFSNWRIDRDGDNAVLEGAVFRWRVRPGTYSVVLVIPAIDTVKSDSGRPVRVGHAFGEGTRSIELVSNPIILHIR